jgi:c-di-GMP-binding flagellar brake protein YcgR
MPPPPERRHSSRLKLKVPVEIHVEGASAPLRGATSDISMLGCYIESMYPFPVGTQLELKLDITSTLLVLGEVITSDPQVGNGIKFVRMLPEDIAELRVFLESAEKKSADAAGKAT